MKKKHISCSVSLKRKTITCIGSASSQSICQHSRYEQKRKKRAGGGGMKKKPLFFWGMKKKPFFFWGMKKNRFSFGV